MLTKEEETERFIFEVKKLEQAGEIKSRRELAQALDWKETLLSNAMNGLRPVPRDKIIKLIKTYRILDFYNDNVKGIVNEEPEPYNGQGQSQGAYNSNHKGPVFKLSGIKIRLSEII